MSERKTQRAKILELLMSAPLQEVPSVELSRISLQYGTRVLELRRLGFRITSRTERRDGIVHAFFRLEREFDGVKSKPPKIRSQQPEPEATLFDTPPSLNYPD
jgi:hypothetical protein